MAPDFTFSPGTHFLSGHDRYKTWPGFFLSPPGWELVTWTNYSTYPGVILYDWVPGNVGRQITVLQTLDAFAAAYMIERLAFLNTATRAGAAGSELVNRANHANGLPSTAPQPEAWYAIAASVGAVVTVGGLSLGGGFA